MFHGCISSQLVIFRALIDLPKTFDERIGTDAKKIFQLALREIRNYAALIPRLRDEGKDLVKPVHLEHLVRKCDAIHGNYS